MTQLKTLIFASSTSVRKHLRSIQNYYSIILFLIIVFLTSTIANAATGDVDLSFNAGNIQVLDANNHIRAIAVQPDNKILIGGSFSSINGTQQNGIARLNSDGSLDTTFNAPLEPFGPGQSASVRAIALQPDGKILVGGVFIINAVQLGMVRLNADGTRDFSFSVNTSNSQVWAIAIQSDGKIIIGGNFGAINGALCYGIARLNPDGTTETLLGATGELVNSVLSIALQADGKIVIGGGFFVNGTAPLRNNLARLNADGTLDNNFNVGSGANNFVYAVAVQPDGKILAGGTFDAINGVTSRGFTRLNTDGSLDSSFTTNVTNGGATAILIQPTGKIIVTGSFDFVNGDMRRGFTRFQTDGSHDLFYPSNNTGADGSVWSVASQPDGNVLIGGSFASVGGVLRVGIARLLNGGLPPPTPTPTPTATPTPTPVDNTPVGSDVAVDLGGININFAQVTVSGNTAAVPGNPVMPLPGGYSVYRNLSYDITTTATTTGLITVSFNLNSLVPGNPVTPQVFSRLRVFHLENGIFVDRTIPPNPVIPPNPILVARVSSLSPFVIGLLNDAPTLDPIADQTVVQGTNLPLTATGHDIDEEQTLTYSLSGDTYGATINAATGSFNWTPGAGQVGAFTFTVNASDNGTPVLSAQRQFTVNVTAPPNAPINLVATAVSKSQINLSWGDNSNNESGFKIERCISKAKGCSNFAQIAQTGSNITTFSDTGLTKGTTYVYRVRAFNGVGNSAYSNIATAKTLSR